MIQITESLFEADTGGNIILAWNAEMLIHGSTIVLSEAGGFPGSCVRAWDEASITLDHTIIAFATEGDALACSESSSIQLVCSNLFGNAEGDSLSGNHHDNYFGNPLFCDAPSHDYTLCADSFCLPANNPWGVLIGAWPQGCGDCTTPVRDRSWGRIKSLYR